MPLLARLGRYARPHRAVLAAALVAALGQALVDIPVPYILRHLVDHVLDRAHTPPPWLPSDRELAVAALFAALLLVAAVKGLTAYARRILAERAGQKIVFDLRCDLFRHLTHLSVGHVRGSSTGRLMLRFIGDVKAILDLITDGVLRAVTDLATVAIVAILILCLNWRLGLLALTVLPVYAVCFARFSPKIRDASHDARDARSVFSGRLQETISGFAVVKSFTREAAEEERLRARTGEMRDHQLRKAGLSGELAGWGNALIGVCAAMVLGYGSLLVLDGGLSRGQLIAFYALVAFLFPPMRRLASINEVYQESMVSLERIVRFVDATADSVERSGTIPYQPGGGAVSLRNVSFAYQPGKLVLNGIDLEVTPGEKVAIVGPNGAGKSSLLGLLPRFHDPLEGSVRIDGQDLRAMTLESLRRAVAVVPQDPFLFSGTIEENILFGRPGATRQELQRALEGAHLNAVLKRLPLGLQTEVGERGLGISGGERQRIAIARAILMDPAILILDEATSGVDAESDAAIRDAVSRLMSDRTVFIIAHRLETTRGADRIVVMSEGRIVEQGTHETLTRLQGLYASLCSRQFLGTIEARGDGVTSMAI